MPLLFTVSPAMPPGGRSGASTVVAAVGAVLLAAGLIMVAHPAYAETQTFPDRRGEVPGPADIVRVVVEHGDRVIVRIRHDDLSFQPAKAPKHLRVVFGVPGGPAGPDFWLRVPYQSDAAPTLRTVAGWAARPGAAVAGCSGERVSVSSRSNLTRVVVARSCFGDPATIRVQVTVTMGPVRDVSTDYAPGVRTLTRAVGYTADPAPPSASSPSGASPSSTPSISPTPRRFPSPSGSGSTVPRLPPVPSASIPPPIPGPPGGPEPV